MSLHVIKGTAAPAVAPTQIGQHFLDTTNSTAYVSVNVNSSADWKRIDNAGAGVTTFLGLTDSPANYTGSAGLVATVNPGETALIFEEGQSPLAEMALSTSNLIGCELTINADPTLFDMAAGTGIHVDNTTTPGAPVVTVVDVPERLGVAVTNLGTQITTSISIDGSGNIIQAENANTASQRRDRFSVGVLIHTSLTQIDTAFVAWVPGYDIKAQLHDLMIAIGFFLTGGNEVSGVTSTLSIKKAAGSGFAPGVNVDTDTKDPHSVTLIAQDPINFFTIKQDGVVLGVDTFLDPTQYDNAGTITTVPSNNNATIKYLYMFATGAMSVLQGQQVYATFSAAVDASGSETVIVPPILDTGILMARIIMKKTATDTTDQLEVRIVASTAISSGGGGSVTTMQGSYDISVQPQITFDSSGGIHYQDASTPIGDFLFKVSNNADTEDFITVDVDGVAGSELISAGLSANTAIACDANGKLISSATTTIELGYVAGSTSNIQNQIDAKEDEVTATTSADIYQGDKTFVPKLGLPISTLTQAALDAIKDPSVTALTPTSGAVALDWTVATVLTHAIAGDSTYTISSQVSGETIAIILTASAAATPTFTGVKWAGGTAPGAMANLDIWTVTLIYDGTNTLGVFQEGFA